MKKSLSFILACFLFLQILAVSVFSVDFSATPLGENATYRIGAIGGNPLTFEAVVEFPEGYLYAGNDKDGKQIPGVGGMIFGNIDGRGASGSFGIFRGNPLLEWYDSGNNYATTANNYTIYFDEIDPSWVYSGKPVHIAIVRVHDVSADDVAVCYVSWHDDNGNLVTKTQTKKMSLGRSDEKEPINPVWRDRSYVLGGDLRGNNNRWFRGGALKKVAVYSEVRSQERILKDFEEGISVNDTSLLGYFDLTDCKNVPKSIADETGKLVATRDYKWNKASVAKDQYLYSMALIGDTQKLVEDAPSSVHYIYDWLINNKQSKKIEYVIGLGDITDESTVVEFGNAIPQIKRLDKTFGTNYLAIRGNHDFSKFTEADYLKGLASGNEKYIGRQFSDFTTYDKAFENSEYAKSFSGISTSGETGRMRSDSILNVYKTANICGVPYLFLALDYGAPDNYYTEDGKMNVLQWADSVVSLHPNHNVIVATHGYLDIDGEPLDGDDRTTPDIRYKSDGTTKKTDDDYLNNGIEMWETFISKHDNICLVVSGHIGYDQVIQSYRERTDDNGNVTSRVVQILSDHQTTDTYFDDGLGMITMLYFMGDGKTVSVEAISSVKAGSGRAPYFFESNQYTFELDLHGTLYDVTPDNGTDVTTLRDLLVVVEDLLNGSGKAYDLTGDGKITLSDILRVVRMLNK